MSKCQFSIQRENYQFLSFAFLKLKVSLKSNKIVMLRNWSKESIVASEVDRQVVQGQRISGGKTGPLWDVMGVNCAKAGPMLGNLVSKLGLCWMLGHLVGYAGPMDPWKLKKYKTQTKLFRLRFILGHLEGYAGPILGRFGSMLGPGWVVLVGYGGFHRGLWEGKNKSQLRGGSVEGFFGVKKLPFRLVEVHFGGVLGLC